MFPRCLLFPICAVFTLQAQTDFSARIAQADAVIARYYRGESIDALRTRSNQEIEAYNAQNKAMNAELEKAKATMEQASAPAQELYAQIQEMDKGLKDIPDGNDQEGNKRFNARVEARNAKSRRLKELNALAKVAIDEYNALVTGRQGELEKDRQRVIGAQETLNARAVAFTAFSKGGQDVAFFIGLNRLLADIRKTARLTPTHQETLEALAKVRELRRELGTWAMAAQARQPNGLVVVEALVNDEPCWFIVDTGAMDTVLSLELVEAAGLSGTLGAENTLIVVGGQRIQGRAFQIPVLTVGGQLQTQVEASAVRPSDVGLDGLLGQSFLKAFVYTIDERKPEKLILTRR